MSHQLRKDPAAFTPAKLGAWCLLLVTLSFFFLVLLLIVVGLAILLIWTLAELVKLGYGPEFFILWMYSLEAVWPAQPQRIKALAQQADTAHHDCYFL